MKEATITYSILGSDQVVQAAVMRINQHFGELQDADRHGNLAFNSRTHKRTITSSDSTQYLWTAEGEPQHGTLQDFAGDLSEAHYGAIDVSDFLLTPDGHRITYYTTVPHISTDDYMTYTVVTSDGQYEQFTIDGRA